jgi:ribonuclease HI
MQFEHQFLLMCESSVSPLRSVGQWRFVAEHLDGRPFLEATDEEAGDRNRLALLALVRGLEALPGPATVTLLTDNRFLIRSMADRLPRWIANQFHWEYFGQRMPIADADLWQRVAHALSIHEVSACCVSAAQSISHRLVPNTDWSESSGTDWSESTDNAWSEQASASLASSTPTATESPTTSTAARVSDKLRRWLLTQCRAVTSAPPQRHVAAMAGVA